MISQQILDGLWGGTLMSSRLSLQSKQFHCEIDVLERSQTKRYELTCSGVQEFRFAGEETSEWDYVELTSVILKDGSRDGSVKLVMELWGGIAKIGLRCVDAQLSEFARE